MNPRFLLAWAAYVVVTFALGFLWHLMLFKKTYQKLEIFSRVNDPIISLGFSAMLIQGAILAYVFPLFPQCGNVLTDGLRFGLVLGAFIASSAVVAEAAKQRVTSLPTWLVIETSYYAVQFGLSGITIALVFEMKA